MNPIIKTLADTTSKVLFRSAEIAAVVDHGRRFRSIEIGGESLRKARWVPGDKLQVRVEATGLALRTYTPIGWDTARGSTRLLAYAHGTGPGSAWVQRATPGHRCQVFGPRTSLKLDDLSGPIVFVGDETSFALVAAWQARHPGRHPAALLLEVDDADESAGVLETVGLRPATIVPRREQSAHVPELAAAVVDAVSAHGEAALCLTGKAQTIAKIRQAIKGAGLVGRSTRVKAYWDEHRAGLD